MEETEFPMVTLVRLSQLLNALLLMEVTEFGMITVEIFEPLTKADGNTSTSSPIVTRSMLEVVMFPFEEQLRAFQTRSVIPLQSENA